MRVPPGRLVRQGKSFRRERPAQVGQLDRFSKKSIASVLSRTGFYPVIAVGGTAPLPGATIPALGEAILSAAGGIRELLDRIEEQRLVEAPD